MDDITSSTIRPAVATDLAAVQAIAEAAYRPYVARNGLEPAPLHEDYAARIAAGQLWVLEQDSAQVGGFLVLVTAANHLLLDNVAVAPSAQGKGYGRALLRFAECHAARAALPAIRLYTQEAMVENIAIYARHGYVETHRAVEHGLPRVFMEKRV